MIFGNRLSVAKFTPELLFSTSSSTARSSPAFLPATITSAVADSAMALRKLFRSLVTWPAPDSTVRLHGLLASRGAAYLDAGISGGAASAEKGALTLMVGGDAEVLDTARPVLDLFSAHIFHCGPSGAGHTVKLLNNFLNAIALSATAEVMVAGKKAGLDLDTLLAVLNASSGVNFATLNRFPKIIHGDYLKGGLTNTLMLKDVNLYVELAARLGVASLNSAGPLASFGTARALGYADEISNTVVDAIGDLSGGVRLHTGEDT